MIEGSENGHFSVLGRFALLLCRMLSSYTPGSDFISDALQYLITSVNVLSHINVNKSLVTIVKPAQ